MQPDLSNIPHAPTWALNLGLFGQGLIFVGLFLFLVLAANAIKPFLTDKVSIPFFWIGTCCLFGALGTLGYLFACDQFEFNYVFAHSDAQAEWKYKLAGIWSGQQGSFLLWACTSSLFGVLAMPRGTAYLRWYQFLFAVFLASLCGILAYETPFEVTRINGVALLPPQGFGLEPSLLNYWMVIHPPTIFTGFGSLTVAAALGFAAMMTGNLKDWVPILRPWTILSTSFLGIGLCMGGFWAYETLGWGGFWAWDPVENVSFIPWVFSIALLHGLLVQQAKKTWYGANLVMAGLPFFVFCYGTFLTRSGFLSEASVHSFAQMNKVALWILAGVVVLGTLGYFGLYAMRGKKLAKELAPATEPSGINRQNAYASGIVLLCGLAAATTIGVSIPFILSLMHRNSKVVEEPLYHQVVVWFFLPIVLLMAVTPLLSWRTVSWKQVWTRTSTILAITVGLTGLSILLFKQSNWGLANPVSFPFHTKVPAIYWIPVLFGICLFAAIANIWRIIETFRATTWSIGGFIAHIGLSVLLAGLIISRGFEQKQTVTLQTGDVGHALDYSISYQGFTHDEEGGILDRDNKVKFEMINTTDNTKFTAYPGFYYNVTLDQQQKGVVWPYLHHRAFEDIYFTLYTPQFDVWESPLPFKIGETKNPDNKGLEVTYNNLRMSGSAGVGRTFIADCTVKVQNDDQSWHTYQVSPTFQITKEGPQPTFPEIGHTGLVLSLERLDASDRSAYLQVHFKEPIWGIDLFYKPMVILVWVGAGIMTLGGFMAAFYRRPYKIKVQKVRIDRTQEEVDEPGDTPS